jgi:mono/diheme cytochrome c family protein
VTGILALSTLATLALVAAILVGLAFVGALIVFSLRRAGDRPDIPPGMRPGPSDEVLERRHVERTMGWGILFVVITAIWLPALWLKEPNQNVEDGIELVSRAERRGGEWFGLTSPENPTGFGCARCHGPEAQGGSVPFTNATTGEFNPAYPVPPLNNVCARLPVEVTDTHPISIRDTIMQGREGTPMPSWSVRFAGPMNDQQITDLIAYLVSIQEGVPFDQNLCTNPAAGAEEEAPAEEESA